MIIAGTGFGIAIIVCAFAPVIGLAYAAMLFVGWASVSFIAIGNSTIQLASEPSMRGRAIALWQVAFQGTTPIGGPLIGWIIDLGGPRTGLAVGGVSCLAAAAGGYWLSQRYRRTRGRWRRSARRDRHRRRPRGPAGQRADQPRELQPGLRRPPGRPASGPLTPTRWCPGGLLVMSSTTRLTSGTSLVIRVEIVART